MPVYIALPGGEVPLSKFITEEANRPGSFEGFLAGYGGLFFLLGLGDPSLCYSFDVHNPLGGDDETVYVNPDLPIAALGSHLVRASLDVELVDADGNGSASITRRNGFPALQRSYVFAAGASSPSADVGQVDLAAPGALHFDFTPAAGTATGGEGVLTLIASFLLSDGDTARFSGKVVLDESNGAPECDIPLRFDDFEAGDIDLWSGKVGAP